MNWQAAPTNHSPHATARNAAVEQALLAGFAFA